MQDAEDMLDRIEKENWLEIRLRYGIFPANRDGDDIVIWSNEQRNRERTRLQTLRQQVKRRAQQHNLALSDFIADKQPDWIGAFCVSAGFGCQERAEAYRSNHDDYNSFC